MSWLKKIFGGAKEQKKVTEVKTETTKTSSSEHLKIMQIDRLTKDAVKVVFDVPENLKEKYQFIPGQYVNLIVNVNGEDLHRSYSICSDVNEPLAIGIKKIDQGKVSSYFNDVAKVGEEIDVSYPIGNFKLADNGGKYLAIAAGSGITPILSMAKSINRSTTGGLHLFYGNRDEASIMFKEELAALSADKLTITHVYSEEKKEGIPFGMLSKEMISDLFRSNLELLKSDGFYICGPEPVIINAKNVLESFGVPESKIHYELFTAPVEMESTSVQTDVPKYEGVSKVTVILDGEEEHFELSSDGDTILEEAESYGMDAPYSCRGAVCCTCRAKVLEGSALMDKNFTLTDKEVSEGYILTCQAHPNSEKLIVSYDE